MVFEYKQIKILLEDKEKIAFTYGVLVARIMWFGLKIVDVMYQREMVLQFFMI